MSFRSSDNFGGSDFCYNLSGKDELQPITFDRVKISLQETSKQLEEINSRTKIIEKTLKSLERNVFK